MLEMLVTTMASPLAADIMKALSRARSKGSTQLQVGSETVQMSPEAQEALSRLIKELGIVNRKEPTTHPITEALPQLRPSQEPEVPAELGGALLTFRMESFRRMRQRLDRVFKVNLTLAIVLFVVLIGGVSAAISTAIIGSATWAAAFGGVSVADLLGIYLLKPIQEIRKTNIMSQRLEMIVLQVHERLEACAGQEDWEKRYACQKAVFESIRADFKALDFK
ncbi:hypothetical protein [Microbispora bryophytorum]|uniref:hypothetical protein n=1 Tax=Microbispora bryophytorum TaxID=1460882 RepID=UPI0033FB4E79